MCLGEGSYGLPIILKKTKECTGSETKEMMGKGWGLGQG